MSTERHLHVGNAAQVVVHSPNHVNCAACRGQLSMGFVSLDPSTPFSEAADTWLQQHDCKPSTRVTYGKNLIPLKAFFQQMPLESIHIGNVRSYQDERQNQVSRSMVNIELGIFRQILDEAGVWEPNIKAKKYKRLRVPKRRGGHALKEEDEKALREIAFSRPKWRLAAHCMIVMLSTTLGFGELRKLRRRDVDLRDRVLTVIDGAKNEYRDRTIPLNRAAYDSILWIIERWEGLGGNNPAQFILPHRPRGKGQKWVLTEPMVSIATAFKNIRKKAGLPYFRVHDCRVQAITKLLSSPSVSPQVSKEIAGHISQAMQDRYSFQQYDTKLAALDALEAPGRKGPQKVIPYDIRKTSQK
jgi:integrase